VYAQEPFERPALGVSTLHGSPLSGQQRTIASSSVPANLREVTARAATIFVGRVISIKPMPPASSDQVGCVQITLQVEQGIRGARAGEHFSFREWVGLWSEADRYRVDQRIMLFRYTRSTLGLTSPVAGPQHTFQSTRAAGCASLRPNCNRFESCNAQTSDFPVCRCGILCAQSGASARNKLRRAWQRSLPDVFWWRAPRSAERFACGSSGSCRR
jgi:hypothetical protein